MTEGSTSVTDRFAIRGDLAIGGALVPGAVVVENDRIAAIVRAPRDGDLPAQVVEAPIVAPGYVDLQVNGGYGVEVGGDPGALRELARRLPEGGVTSYLPTVISSSAAIYRAAFAAFDVAGDALGARALGFHLEGPFLSPARKGAHPIAAIEGADPALLDELLAGDRLRLMTIAPERPGGVARIRRLRERGVLVSLGHTDATVEEFTAGVDAGAAMATHLYNAMSPFGHRAPGAIGGALADERVTVGLIADGVHCHPAAVRLAIRAKGIEGVALVTDLMAAAGMPPGTYPLGGRPVTTDGRAARLANGTLAGAVLLMDGAVRNAAVWAGLGPAAAIRMATEVPACLLGRDDLGHLRVGALADLVLLERDLTVRETLVGGRSVYRHLLPSPATAS